MSLLVIFALLTGTAEAQLRGATPTTGQARGAAPLETCPQPRPACNFSTVPDVETKCSKDLDYCIFRPTLPGNYTFKYVAEDLCDGKTSRTQTLEVKCPPEPTADLQVMPKSLEESGIIDVLQGTSIKFDASKSTANSRWAEAPTKDRLEYSYCITKPGSDGVPSTPPCYAYDDSNKTNWRTITSNDWTFEIPTAETAASGDYSVTLKVFDGCSFGQVTKCFKIRCNCGPTANAQASVATYTNQHYAGTTFTLDGSNSYDFDISDTLQYIWRFVRWEPAPKMPYPTLREPSGQFGRMPFPKRTYMPDPRDGGLVWYAGFKQDATQTQFGYTVEASATNTDLNQVYTFKRLAKLIVDQETVDSTELRTGRDAVETVTTNETCSGATDYKANANVQTECKRNNKEDVEFCKFADVASKCSNIQAYPRWVAARVYDEDGKPAKDATPSLYFNDGAVTGYEENFQTNSQQAIMNTANNQPFKDWKADWHSDRFQTATTNNLYDPITTACVAYVEKTVAITTLTQSHTNITSKPRSEAGTDYSYCRIRINQNQQTDQKASFTIEYPEPVNSAGRNSEPPLPDTNGAHAYEMCRGLWTFELKVIDQCGPKTADTDNVTISIRCNRPPVAVLCCNTTVVYNAETSSFPQVTLDGRSSNDGSMDLGSDNQNLNNNRDDERDDLTYYWNFLSYPEDHVTKCLSESPAGQMVPCQQNYCNLGASPSSHTFIFTGGNCPANGPRFTDTFGAVYRTTFQSCGSLPTAGNQAIAAYSRWGTGNDRCGPHVYRPIYNMDAPGPTGCVAPGLNRAANVPYCTYSTVGTTGKHSGNSAHFVPYSPGQYLVQLAVHDGCSTTVDTTVITAVCPAISGVIQVTPRTGFYYPAGTSGETSTKIELKSTIQYEGDLQKSALTYQWKVDAPAGVEYSCDGDCRTAATSFTPRGRGTFTVSLEVSDGCATAVVIGSAVTVLIACNTPPVATPINLGTGRDDALYPTGTRTIDPADAQTAVMQLDKTSLQFPSVTIIGLGTDAEKESLTTVWSISDAVNTSAPVDLRVNNFPTPTSNNTFTFSPQFSANTAGGTTTARNAQNLRYVVTYRVRDGCQESQAIQVRVSFSCDTTMRVVLTPSTRVVFEYDFTTERFSSKEIDAATGSTFPYPSTVRYNWRLRDTSSSTDLKEGTQATTDNSAKLTWTPVPDKLTQYRIDLSVSDGCTTSSISTTAESVCPNVPIARLELDGGSSQIQWDSRGKDLYSGQFPQVSLTGKGSQLTGATIKEYLFSVLNPQVEQKQDTATYQYRPLTKGTFEFRLRVRNGPCESPPTPSVIVTAVCLRLGFSLRTNAGSVAAPSPAAFTATWNGVRFQNVDLDARSVSYRDNVNVEGNYNSLRYTWTVDASPEASLFEPTTTGIGRGSSPYARIGLVTTTLADNATYYSVKRDYLRVSRTAVVTTTTTLMNHHFNRPMTCFRPDIRGSYVVTLKVEDGCVDPVTMSISIQAVCNQPVIVPQLTMSDGVTSSTTTLTTTLSGYTYKRVTFDARSVTPNSGRDTLTYQWTVTPEFNTAATSGLSKPTTDLTNPHGNIASFVPTRGGSYKIELKVFDGCNDPVSATGILVVVCPAPQIPDYGMFLYSFDMTKMKTGSQFEHDAGITLTAMRDAVIRYRGIANKIPDGASQTRFTDNKTRQDTEVSTLELPTAYESKYYKLQARPTAPCYVKKSYFEYVPKRQCTTPYDLSALPPAVTTTKCTNKEICQWSVIEYPCGLDKTTNRFPRIGPPPDITNCDGTLPCVAKSSENCNANFICQSPGTYRLQLRVDDGCSVVTENTTVTCKCQNVLRALPPAPKIVTYQCQAQDKTYRFPPETLVGKFEVNTPRDNTGYLNMSCPSTKPAAVPVPPSSRGSCCPTPDPCPNCPSCPACSCVGTFAGSAPAPPSRPEVIPGSDRLSRPTPSFKSKQTFHAQQESSDESLTVMLGTAVPIAAVTVISLVCNVILFKIYQLEDE